MSEGRAEDKEDLQECDAQNSCGAQSWNQKRSELGVKYMCKGRKLMQTDRNADQEAGSWLRTQ